MILTVPRLGMPGGAAQVRDHYGGLVPQHRGVGRSRASIRQVHHLRAGALLEVLHGDMRVGPVAERAIVELAGFRLGERDEVLHRSHRRRRRHDHDRRHLAQHEDRGEVLLRIVPHLAVEMRCGGQRAVAGQQQRVAVGRRLRDSVGAERFVAPRTIVDDDRLSPRLRQRLADRAGENVGHGAGRGRNDDLDGAVGILVLRQAQRRTRISKEQHAV